MKREQAEAVLAHAERSLADVERRRPERWHEDPLRSGDASAAAPLLPGHEARTAYEKGWPALLNGELPAAAEAEGFAVIVTTDMNLLHRQNAAILRLGIVVLPATDWSRIRPNAACAVAALDRLRPPACRRPGKGSGEGAASVRIDRSS